MQTLLVVDLDGTLLKTDLLYEQLILLAKVKPFCLLKVPFWLLSGKVRLKERLMAEVEVKVDLLPYSQKVVAYILEEKSKGARVVLASASHERLVQKVADFLGYFDEVHGTRERNLKGKEKLRVLREKWGDTPFTYLGDAKSDFPIWAASQLGVAVNPSWGTRLLLRFKHPEVKILMDRSALFPSLFKQVRLYQWVKNLLLFIPLLAGHYFSSRSHWEASILGFLAFSFLASLVYILNDLLDLEVDRQHFRKRHRPLASGNLSIQFGLGLWLICLILALGIGSRLSDDFLILMGIYLSLNLLYSLWLKRVLVVDVVLLAGLYSIRILAGGKATGIPISQWLLAFSVFFFFSLALIKRYVELFRVESAQAFQSRGYQSEDRPVILGLGTGSSFLSVLVLALYLNSDAVAHLYRFPDRLWLVTPILLYWTSRAWLLASRGRFHDDPVIFVLKDKASVLVLFCLALVLRAAL